MNIHLNANAISNKVHKANPYSSIKTSSSNADKKFEIICNSANYADEIRKKFPAASVSIKSMTGLDVKKYYESWKNQSGSQEGKAHSITISPKVIDKMNFDEEYGKQMMSKIGDAATPKGFEQAELLEYKVFVTDEGEIEVLACAYFGIAEKMSKKNGSSDDGEKRAERDKLRLLDYVRYIYHNKELKVVKTKKADVFMNPYQTQGAMFFSTRNHLRNYPGTYF